MQLLKSGFVVLGSVGLIFLGACSNGNQAANPDASSSTAKPSESASPAQSAKTESSAQGEWPPKGGQTVESGKYHLQFVPEKEDKGTHLDFYFLKDNDKHEPIPNAKVTGQVQLPDGTQKTLNFTYDSGGKHYTVLLPVTATGQYQVKMTSDFNGEKVNGRFTFNQ